MYSRVVRPQLSPLTPAYHCPPLGIISLCFHRLVQLIIVLHSVLLVCVFTAYSSLSLSSTRYLLVCAGSREIVFGLLKGIESDIWRRQHILRLAQIYQTNSYLG
uniref:Uncharacterized protein n=1 Tax=Cacopsylla melanoneura TaxID=428564 RepID=A0A8D8PNS3_9HEMI